MTRYLPEFVLWTVLAYKVNSACASGQWSVMQKFRSLKVYSEKSGLLLPAPQPCYWVRHVAIQVSGFQVLQNTGRSISDLLGE